MPECDHTTLPARIPLIIDNIVGDWDMVRADAVAYVDGYRYDGIKVETEGAMSFSSEGTGRADFTITINGDGD